MNAICTTTINPPTEALKRFAAMEGWTLYIAGDLKTPHEAYKNYPHYLSLLKQEDIDKELSDIIGWNTVSRRSMAIVQAYRDGAEYLAMVDDDNIPLENWGKTPPGYDEVELYESANGVFDPLSVFKEHNHWHRGYPLHLVNSRTTNAVGTMHRKHVVLASLWNGAPDIDAVCRALHPEGTEYAINGETYYGSYQLSPFNSQNTIIAREAIPFYYLFPKQGRMDDIYASYVLQKYFPGGVVYSPPTVFQLRNPHNILDDMQKEIHGYFVDPYKVRDLAEKIDEPFCAAYKKALG